MVNIVLKYFRLFLAYLVVCFTLILYSKIIFAESTNRYVGGTVCDYLARRTWDVFWKETDPILTIHENGFEWARVWVTTKSSVDLKNTPPSEWSSLPWKNEYWSSLEYAEEILKEASHAGMKLNLVFFLSDEAAHAGVQNAPPEWENLTVEETAIVLEDYCYQTTEYFKEKGFHIEIYDIGNEIEWGILNFRPDERIYRPPNVDKTTDMEYMKNNIWNIEAIMLKGAIKGVRQADPNSKIVLHIDSLGINPENLVVRNFFKTMIEEGVDFDYAGLSYPYVFYWQDYQWPRPYFKSSEIQETIDYLASLGVGIVFSEFNYPNTSENITATPDNGYPFTSEGQAEWVRDFLSFCTTNEKIIGIFYWYPDYFPGMHHGEVPEVESSGLFISDTEIQPAMQEFRIFLKSISGVVTGDVQADVSLTLSGVVTQTTSTDSSGEYSFTNLCNGTYIIMPEKSGYAFTPSSRIVIVNDANQTGINFVGTVIATCVEWNDVLAKYQSYVSSQASWNDVITCYQEYTTSH
jgi:arabinogalactan endo-1,4-beta-galactosidase